MAAMIPQTFIDDLLRRVDVVDVVGQYVPLKRTGANYSGLCPFHTEKSPSFSVSPSKQFYHCFGCGAHGTALGFLIEHLGLPFPQAVEDLARRVGLEVPREAAAPDPQARKQETDLRARLKDSLLEAARFYQRRLRDSTQAIDYLKGRGVSGEIAARYHLGYAPEGWQSLQSVFADYASPDLGQAGLVIDAENGRRYDRFRHRIMFPILSTRGEVLGFGARAMGDEEPKYLNSPETPVFSKGAELYGVFEARQSIREARQVWVVEGYMDVVALAQHGLGHAVATLGTATTPQHLQQLLRLSDHLVFMFDGDAAGRKAAARALETAMPFASEKNRIDFVFLPQEHDPDSFVREQGAQALRDWVARAMPLSAFLLEVASQGQQLDIPEGRAAAAAALSRLMSAMPANGLKAQILREGARRFDMPDMAPAPVAAPAQWSDRSRNGGQGRRAPGGGTATPGAGRMARPVVRPLAERLLQILVRRPVWAREVPAAIAEAMDVAQQELLAWVVDRAGTHEQCSFAMLYETATAEGRERGSDVVRYFLRLAAPDAALDELADGDPAGLRADFDRTLERLELRLLEDEASRLASQAAGDPTVLAQLAELRREIARRRAASAS
jgi:DNA primase